MLEWIEGWAPEFSKPLLRSLFSSEVLAWVGLLSVACLVLSVIAVPYYLIRLPVNYFMQEGKPAPLRGRRLLVRVTKNALGCILFLAGIAMLILPGQGLLTGVVALLLIDFPGKRRFELWLVHRPGVLRTINALRRRAHKPPLQVKP